MESFWRHSLACALAARALAINRSDPGPVEPFFVAGMLHDVGRLIMFARMPEASREALVRSSESGQPLRAVEKQLFGYDHAAAGAALMQVWNLPHSLSEATHYHHQPSGAISRTWPRRSMSPISSLTLSNMAPAVNRSSPKSSLQPGHAAVSSQTHSRTSSRRSIPITKTSSSP